MSFKAPRQVQPGFLLAFTKGIYFTHLASCEICLFENVTSVSVLHMGQAWPRQELQITRPVFSDARSLLVKLHVTQTILSPGGVSTHS